MGGPDGNLLPQATPRGAAGGRNRPLARGLLVYLHDF
jgi:hypothetical protein